MKIHVQTKSQLQQKKDKETGETRFYRKCWFAISFSYNRAIIDSLKAAKAWWSPTDKTWCLPFTKNARQWIIDHSCSCTPDAKIIVQGLGDKDRIIKRAIEKHYPNGVPRRVPESEISGKMWLVDLNQRLLEKESQ